MFYDRAKVYVEGGHGGNGCVSFRREAHVPKGGPDGGDGGRGGSVIFCADSSLRDLASFRHRTQLKAERGRHGEGSDRHGASGKDLVVHVPCGTLVEDHERGFRIDLVAPGQQATVAEGGLGGAGNHRFASSTRQAPGFAQLGLPGTEGWLELQLKLLADVGLVGLPNAGKSSLLGRISHAHPKVGSYPFTTIEPVLGTVELDHQQLVVADLPGLIEGASGGAGLGHEFLAHVERTALIVYVVDIDPIDGSDAWENFQAVKRELELHDRRLLELDRFVALNKSDLLPELRVGEVVDRWRGRLGGEVEVLAVSAATGAGLPELVQTIFKRMPRALSEEPVAVDEIAEFKLYRPGGDHGFTVERDRNGGLAVRGRGVEMLAARTDLSNEEALHYLEERLRAIGVVKALEAKGFEPGDELRIGETVFEFDPGAPHGRQR